MNKERRSEIKKANNKLKLVTELLESYKNSIEDIQMDEEFAFDNLPESFQDGLKGDAMQDAIDELEDTVDKINNMIKEIEDIKDSLSVL